jgi:hypothetical protein
MLWKYVSLHLFLTPTAVAIPPGFAAVLLRLQLHLLLLLRVHL